MPIHFDAGAADRLATACERVAATLRDQALPRNTDRYAVMEDFEGSYATLFWNACLVESEDRPRLAGQVESLGLQAGMVGEDAARERRRRKDLAAWRERQAERERNAGLLQDIGDGVSSFFDPQPSTQPIRPRPISAACQIRSRRRTGGGGPSTKTSADPERLRSFATSSRAGNTALEYALQELKYAWTGFLAACSWARIDSMTCVSAFEQLLSENVADAGWADDLAGRFEHAGGGGLSDAVLDLAGAPTLPKAVTELMTPGLTPDEAAEVWKAISLDPGEIEAYVSGLPLEVQLQLANLDGIPFTARDTASRAVLDAAVEDPEQVYELLGLAPSDMSMSEFNSQVTIVAVTLTDADRQGKVLPGDSSNRVVQLIGFGVHDGALVAALSHGDLDAAAKVLLNVPGMGSTVSDFSIRLGAARDLLKAATMLSNDSYAAVTWIGGRAPSVPEVGSMGRAESAAPLLAQFIDGVYESRSDRPPEGFTVYGHSYGSTVAAEALKHTKHTIDAFVAYGSVGFEADTTVEQLHVTTVYATDVDGPGLSPLGRGLSLGRRIDPRDLSGVNVFSAEASNGLRGVTGHDMYPEGHGYRDYLLGGPQGPYDPAGSAGEKVGFMSPGSVTQAEFAKIGALAGSR